MVFERLVRLLTEQFGLEAEEIIVTDGYAIKNAIAQAAKFASSGIIESITANVEYMRLPTGAKAAEELTGGRG